MMEKIYTIPVNEAFDESDACPLCTIIHKLEDARVKYMLGPAMMEPDIRILTNKDGFCKRHYKMLFAQENKLSLALILQTHLEEIIQNLSSRAEQLPADISKKKRLFKKNDINLHGTALLLSRATEGITDNCVICSHIEDTFSRYIDTMFYMWKNDNGFKQKFAKTKSFCLEHYGLLAKSAVKFLDTSDALEFLKILTNIEQIHLNELKGDINRFIAKFDYRNKDLPWENAKDSIKRTIITLSRTELE